MTAFRLNRLFNSVSRRCLALEVAPHFSSESAAPVLGPLAHAGLDAVQLTIGHAEFLQSIPGKQKPALILRGDVSNVEGAEPTRTLFCRMIGNAADQALRLDAAAVVLSLVSIPDRPEITAQSVENLLRIKPICEQWCLPLLIKVEPFRLNAFTGRYEIDRGIVAVWALLPQVLELGADLIEVGPLHAPDEIGRIQDLAGNTPVLYRSDENSTDSQILETAETVFRSGAAGFTCGDSLLRQEDPASVCEALAQQAHGGAGRLA